MAKSAAGLPPPPKHLDATLITWGGGLEFHRVHDLAFGGSEFNTSTKGDARFSPITDDAGVLIPTLYAGTTLDCALMETIFHDVPFKAGFKPFSKLKIDGKVHTSYSQPQTSASSTSAQLHSTSWESSALS